MGRFQELPPDEYARLDIAEVNLQCASELLDWEEVDVPGYLRKIDRWTDQVRQHTHKWFPYVRDSGQCRGDSDAKIRAKILTPFCNAIWERTTTSSGSRNP